MGAPTFLDLAASIDRTLHRNINWPLRAVTAAGTTALGILDRKVTVDATLGNITLTLPSSVVAFAGMDFEITRIDGSANTVTIQPATGGQLINGAASYSLVARYQGVVITTNGTNFFTFSQMPSLDQAAQIGKVLARNINWPIRTVTAAGTTALAITDRQVIVDATLGNITLTLPSSVTATGGMDFEIVRKDASANTVTIQPATGGQLINGAATYVLVVRYQPVTITTDGTNFYTFVRMGTIDDVVKVGNALTKNIQMPFRAITTTPVALAITDYYVTVSAAGGSRVITLPSAATVGAGVGYKILRIDGTLSNSVTISPTGGETINGAASATIGLQYSSLELVSDGTNWLLFASPAAFALSNDVLWVFGGQLSTDQNSSIFELKAKRAMAFVALDADVRVAPTGSAILIDWAINGGIDIANRVTIADGATFGTLTIPVALAVDDLFRPVITQVGSTTPGQTIVMRARGM